MSGPERPVWLWVSLTLLVALWAACARPGPLPDEGPVGDLPPTAFLYEETDDPEDPDPAFAEYEETNLEPYVLLGTLVLPDAVIRQGGVWVEDGVILDVWDGDRPDSLAHVVTITTGGIILPGLIDLHNHVAYNFLPLWESEIVWGNRYEWQAATAYRRAVSEPYGRAKQLGLLDETNKFGEIRGLVGGTTSILGAAPSAGSGILARNVDQRTLGADFVRTHVGWVDEFGCARGRPRCAEQGGAVERLVEQFEDGSYRSMIFHLAEGVDVASRDEFRWLEENGLLRAEIVVTHGTGLTPVEFRKMAQANMGLIWSPRSNVELYAGTTDVRAAREAGVRIALAPDWSPSGSSNLLAEIRYAARFNQDSLGGFFSAQDLVRMATAVPGELAGRADHLGRLQRDFVADLLVLERIHDDAFESIIRSDERHVRLVAVNGVPLYGFPSWLDRLGKEGDYERVRIRGRVRALDTTVPEDAGVRKGTQTFRAIWAALEAAYEPWGRLPSLTANEP